MITDFQREIMYRGLATRGRLKADSEECALIDGKLKETPDDYYLWAARGCVCAGAEEAIESYSMAISIRPLAPNMLFNRGRRYMSLNRYPQALADLCLSTQLDPEDGWKWHFQGVALYFLERYQEAAAAFLKAIDANNRGGVPLIPFDVDWLWNCYGQLGDSLSQAECLKQVGPDTPVLDTEESYGRRLKLYNGYMNVQEFLDGIDYEDPVEAANQLYGLANYCFYILHDTARSVKYLEETLACKGGERSWGYKMALLDMPARVKQLSERGC